MLHKGGYRLKLYFAHDFDLIFACCNLSSVLSCRATFEIAPVYTTIERTVLDKMCSMLGYDDGDGIFSPGNVKHCIYVHVKPPLQVMYRKYSMRGGVEWRKSTR